MRGLTCGILIAAAVMVTSPLSAESGPRADALARSIIDVRVLSPRWICVVVDPTEEILAVRHEEYGAELEAEKARFEAGDLAWWYWPFAQKFRMLNVQTTYHQPLFASFNQREFWTVNGGKPIDVTVWPHSIDAFPNWAADDVPVVNGSDYSRVADMVYLGLPSALKPGSNIEVNGRDGRSASRVFDDAATPCWSIKVNQGSYAADATTKRAYLGMWLPGIGPADFSTFEGRPFHVRAFEAGTSWRDGRATGEPLYTGAIRLRMKAVDQEIRREGGANATGEDVYELDFSAVTEDGVYCIQIPGLGRSWPFRISRSGYADAFYTMMKGLFIQRCGCALDEPHTAWSRPACHQATMRGQFIPESERWYANKYRDNQKGLGFRNEAGERIGLSTFTLVGNEDPGAPVMEGVRGGWHDAADFDRRLSHFDVVYDLLTLFEGFPGRFRDGVLTMPESGNGVPDLLDEAVYGVEVWRRTQREDGAVSSWIEQESHPGASTNLEAAFVENQMPFYAATPDRAGSYAYAAAASWLGRLLAPYDAQRAHDYQQSARRAYAWAGREDGVMRGRRFVLSKPMRNPDIAGQTIVFDEDPEIAEQDRAFLARAFAAACLFAATGDARYERDLADSHLGRDYDRFASRMHPGTILPLLNQPGLAPAEKAAVKEKLLAEAGTHLDSQARYAYRTLWRSPDDGWFHAMGWGSLHQRARLLVTAYALTRDPRYKAGLESAADFFLGCNPMGQSMITGMGTVYPVVLQHIHSLSDGLVEPTPGIAPYTFTFGVPMRPFVLADNGHPSVAAYFTNIAVAFLPDRLGRAEIQAALDAHPKTGNWMHEASRQARSVVWSNFPVFRRKVTHPSSAVDQNEFTVNETISPLALLFGALTTDDGAVPEAIRERRPRTAIDDVPYYSMP